MPARHATTPIVVPFRGDRAVVAPMTLGQLNIFEWAMAEDRFFATLEQAVDVPAGCTVGDVTAALAVLLGRHEALRTRYAEGGRRVQRVLDTGELVLQRHETDDPAGSGTGRAELEAELVEAVRTPPLDPSAGLPVRVAVATRGERVLAVVVACTHLAVDAEGLAIVCRELGEMLRDPAARQVGPPRRQPVDRAAAEAVPPLARRAEAALAYCAGILETMQPVPFPAPSSGEPARSGEVALRSTAAATALARIARRTRTGAAAVVLAAAAAARSAVTGYPRCEVPVMAGNRGEAGLAGYVGTLAQSTPISLEVAGCSFDTLVRRAYAAVLAANRQGVYDIYRRVELQRQIEDRRGVRFTLEPFFNNVAPAGAPPGVGPRDLGPAGDPDPVLRRRFLPPVSQPMVFVLHRVHPSLVLRLWTRDVTRLPFEQLADLQLAIHRLLLAAAARDLGPDDVGAGRARRGGGGGRGGARGGGAGGEGAAGPRLVAEAVGVSAVEAAAPAGAAGPHAAPAGAARLVAHLAAGDRAATPEQAHRACLAALARYPDAITPGRYVLHEGTPPRPDDPASWRGLPVVAEGPGRPLP